MIPPEIEGTKRELVESEERFSLLVASVKDYAIFMLDPEGHIASWNAGAERIKGYTAQEIIGQHFSRFYPEVDIRSGKPPYELAVATEEGRFEDEGWRLRKDGSRFWANVIITAVRDAQGHLRGFAKVTRDLTERKRAEDERAAAARSDAARAEAERTSALLRKVQAITDAAFAHLSLEDLLNELVNRIHNLLGVDTSVILLLADGGDALMVRAAAGVEGGLQGGLRIPLRSGFLERLSSARRPIPLDEVEHAEILSPVVHGKGVRSVLAVPLLVEGQLVGLLHVGALQPRALNADDARFLELVADRVALAIEHARLYEAERRARTEAEIANRSKDEFLATVSHELRTPLQSILGWARLLEAGRLAEPDRSQAVETIIRNASAQAHLVDDILDVSRITRGEIRLNLRPVEVAIVAERAIEALRAAAYMKKIRLQTLLDPAAGQVLGDEDRLRQVVWNLLSNAIKFTPPGGAVEVRVEPAGDRARIVVRDTGQGIPPEFVPRMFDRFTQADATRTRVHGGLGLGLSIVRDLVQLHGGTVEVASAGENRGATFTVELPLRAGGFEDHAGREELPEAWRLRPTLPALAGVRVLVVEDEPDTLHLLASIMTEAKADVRTAGSAAEAFELLRRSPPHVLVSDIAMPGEDGYALIEKVRALSPQEGGDVPALALTAHARDEERRRALAAGYHMHAAKPVEPAALLEAVESLAALGRSRSPRPPQFRSTPNLPRRQERG